MVKVKKANRVLTVKESLAADYLKRGYDQIDDAGKVIKAGVGRDVDAKAAKRIAAAEAENEALAAENAALKAENEALAEENTQLKAAEAEKKSAKK